MFNIGEQIIWSVMTVFRTQWFETVFVRSFKNLHFADNRKDDKTDEALKMSPAINHLHSKFSELLSNNSDQSIGEHKVKLKGRSGMKQYIKSKPINWVSSSGFTVRVNLVICIERKDLLLSRSGGRSSYPADERLGATVLHCLFWQLF